MKFLRVTDFQQEEDCFYQLLNEDYPDKFNWKVKERRDPYWQLDQRDPNHPEIVPGPFLDYFIRDECYDGTDAPYLY